MSAVLDVEELEWEAQHIDRDMIVEKFGIRQVGIAPKFSDTPSSIRRPPSRPGAHTAEILAELGLPQDALGALT